MWVLRVVGVLRNCYEEGTYERMPSARTGYVSDMAPSRLWYETLGPQSKVTQQCPFHGEWVEGAYYVHRTRAVHAWGERDRATTGHVELRVTASCWSC
eukprot:910358-Pleurochrysis_carterae.AAC.3